MSVLSAIFLVLSLAAAVMVGPQMRQWPWGPSLLLLGISLLTALPALWKNKRLPNPAALIVAIFTGAWFAWRAWMSPVAEFAAADAILLTAVIGTSLAAGPIFESEKASAVFLWGLAILLALSLWVIGRQIIDPTYSPIFPARPRDLPSGFFGHYNDGANFLVGVAFLLGASSISSRHPNWARIFWGLVSIAGIGAVYFTRSRGGILAGAGSIFLLAVILWIAAPKRSKWSAAFAIGLPLIGILAGILLWQGWSAAQQARYQTNAAETAMDNPIRLSLLDIASQCIALKPWSGGGSRSFSWNNYQFWDNLAHGPASARPEMVHNELVQSATDYGLVGSGLLILLFSILIILAVLRLISNKANPSSDSRRLFLIVGGLVALAGMLVQSSFSFVFHILPGALLLGLSLSAFGWPGTSDRQTGRGKAFAILSCLTALALTCVLFFTGWKRTQVLALLWKPYFAQTTSLWSRADALERATKILPLPSLFKERGVLLQTIANSADSQAARARDLALKSYTVAIQLHPFDPVVSLNRAILLDLNSQDIEAEKEFVRTIQIEGGAENLFRGHLRYADFLLRRGTRQIDAQDYPAAIATLRKAMENCDQVREKAPWIMPNSIEGVKLDAGLHENLGNAHFLSGEMEEALKYYQKGAKIQTGARINYRASLVFARYAEFAWSERRPSEALARFQQAKQRLAAATELPSNVTPEEKADYEAYLDEKIGFLVGARIEPMKLDPE